MLDLGRKAVLLGEFWASFFLMLYDCAYLSEEGPLPEELLACGWPGLGKAGPAQ
jgi:hypothetical protein